MLSNTQIVNAIPSAAASVSVNAGSAGGANVISGNTFVSTPDLTYGFAGADTISGNTFQGPLPALSPSLSVLSAPDGLSIQGNTFSNGNSGGAAVALGPPLTVYAGATFQNVTVSNNTITTGGGTGILLETAGNGVTISGNTVAASRGTRAAWESR